MKRAHVSRLARVRRSSHFRHSYSQNVLDHSVEVAHLMALMAAELGLDVAAARRAGLLHDIGKALHHEIEGPHAVVGAELLKRFKERHEVAVIAGFQGLHKETGRITTIHDPTRSRRR